MRNSRSPAHRFDLLTPSIFFTPVLLFFILVLLFISLLYGQKELALFSLLVVVGSTILKLWSRFSPRHMTHHVFVDRQKLFPGEKAAVRLTIENNKPLPVFIKIDWRIDHFLQADGRKISIEEESGLFWHQGVVFHRECIAQKRGCYRIGGPALTTGDFFGFFPREAPGAPHLEILVYPRRVPIKPFPLIKRIIFGKPGAASPVRDPAYILGARDYQPFRPARYIHWKASARHNRLQEKILEPAEQDKVLLVLDVEPFFEHEAHDEFERTVEALAALAAELESQHYASGFVTNAGGNEYADFFLPIARRPGHLAALLEILAKVEIRPKDALATVLERVQDPPADAICIYFSYQSHTGKTWFDRRRTPTVVIAGGPGPDKGARPSESIAAGGVYYLKDILATAEENDR